jgi:glycosyltransferase involved in cell wall biosynthesis
MKKKEIVLGIIIPSDLSKNMVSGGASGFLRNIIPYFKTKKTIIFGIGSKEIIPWKTYHLNLNVDFIPICNLKLASKIPMRFKVLIYYIRYRYRIMKSGVDILYIQMPECCLPFLNNRKGIPVIYHKHGSANPVAKSKYVYGRIILFRKFYEIALMLIYRSANWIITIDRLSLQDAYKNGAKSRTSLLMNAVDTEKYFPDAISRVNSRKVLGLIDNIFVILFVGRIEKTKGPEHLLDCIPYLKQANRLFHIFLAGEGSYKPYLEKKVKIKNYDSNVTFLGYFPHEEMADLYNMADVMVLPSETEGVPMVILEALACGTPVIATNVGGIPDIIFNGVNGIILDDISPARIATAITNLLYAKFDREKIARSVKNFDARNFVKSFNNIISSVVSKK